MKLGLYFGPPFRRELLPRDRKVFPTEPVSELVSVRPDVNGMNSEDQLTGPIAPAMARQNHESEEFHDRDDVSLISFLSETPQTFAIPLHVFGMEYLRFPIDGSDPIQSGVSPHDPSPGGDAWKSEPLADWKELLKD